VAAVPEGGQQVLLDLGLDAPWRVSRGAELAESGGQLGRCGFHCGVHPAEPNHVPGDSSRSTTGARSGASAGRARPVPSDAVCCPSATLAVWSSAWLHGAAPSDNVLDALLAWGEAHEVVTADEATADAFDLPVTGGFPAQPAQLLGALRRTGGNAARLVRP